MIHPKLLFLLSCILAIAVGSLAAQTPDIRTKPSYHRDGEKLKEKYSYYYDFWSEKEVKHGRSTAWYANGNRRWDGEYYEGKLHGLYQLFYVNGELKLEQTYQKGKLNGMVKEYFPNGRLKKTTTYVMGFKHGKQVRYRKNGKVKKIVTYQDGKLLPSPKENSAASSPPASL